MSIFACLRITKSICQRLVLLILYFWLYLPSDPHITESKYNSYFLLTLSNLSPLWTSSFQTIFRFFSIKISISIILSAKTNSYLKKECKYITVMKLPTLFKIDILHLKICRTNKQPIFCCRLTRRNKVENNTNFS